MASAIKARTATVAAEFGHAVMACWDETIEAEMGRSGLTPVSMAISLITGRRLYTMWPVPHMKVKI